MGDTASRFTAWIQMLWPIDEPHLAGRLRAWHVSPRFANPDGYPINQVSAPPELTKGRLSETN